MFVLDVERWEHQFNMKKHTAVHVVRSSVPVSCLKVGSAALVAFWGRHSFCDY